MLGRFTLVAGVVLWTGTVAHPARAQSTHTLQQSDTTLRVRGLKDPVTAEALGIFPGGGMMYAGHWQDGIATYFLTVSAIGAGGMTILEGELRGCGIFDPQCHPHRSVWPTRILGSAVIISGVAAWGYQAVHAGRVVRRDNARKIDAARDSARTARVTNVHAFIAPSSDARSLALGVRAAW